MPKKNEDAPANATGAAVAGTGDDSSVVKVKKKKKIVLLLLLFNQIQHLLVCQSLK